MENIKALALNKKGQFTNLTYARTCKVKKNSPVIEKMTKAFNVRVGAQYDALKVVQNIKGTTTTEETHEKNNGLNGMEWVVYPYILKSIKSGKEYLRLETAKNTRFETVYTMDGRVVDKAEVEPYLLASEKSKGEMPIVMNIGLENITEIH